MAARRRRGGFLAYLLALLTLVTSSAAASGQSSPLDPTFGAGGRVATAAEGLAPDWPATGPGPTLRPASYGDDVHLATSPDGSLVVSHGNLLLRYLPTGQLDRDFGEAGRLAISTVEGLPFGLADIAVDAEGKILAFGTTVDPSISRFIQAYAIREVSPSFVTVLRFDSTGALDQTFGGGDGVFREGLGLQPVEGVPADIPLVEAESAQLDSEGRAWIAVGKVGFPPSTRSTPDWASGAVVRLTPSGTLDPSFSEDGIVDDTAGDNGLTALYDSCSFGDQGNSWAADGARFPVCDHSGHFFLLDGPRSYFPTPEDPSLWKVIRRSADDGHLDTHFNRRAFVRVRGRYSLLTSLAVDRQGGLLLSGFLKLPSQDKRKRSSFFTVFRLLPSGRLDRNFGHVGRTRTGFGRSASISSAASVIDASGRLVLAGNANAPWLQPGGVVLARYLLDQ